jgi:hypothetical protein
MQVVTSLPYDTRTKYLDSRGARWVPIPPEHYTYGPIPPGRYSHQFSTIPPIFGQKTDHGKTVVCHLPGIPTKTDYPSSYLKPRNE